MIELNSFCIHFEKLILVLFCIHNSPNIDVVQLNATCTFVMHLAIMIFDTESHANSPYWHPKNCSRNLLVARSSLSL